LRFAEIDELTDAGVGVQLDPFLDGFFEFIRVKHALASFHRQHGFLFSCSVAERGGLSKNVCAAANWHWSRYLEAGVAVLDGVLGAEFALSTAFAVLTGCVLPAVFFPAVFFAALNKKSPVIKPT